MELLYIGTIVLHNSMEKGIKQTKINQYQQSFSYSYIIIIFVFITF